MKLAYLHVIEGATGGPRDADAVRLRGAALQRYKQAHPGRLDREQRLHRAMALDVVASGAADAVAFGKPFIANPDLVRRLRDATFYAPLNRCEPGTCSTAVAPSGYTDYPTLELAAARLACAERSCNSAWLGACAAAAAAASASL
jgi:N-ethylmaleimide reductase